MDARGVAAAVFGLAALAAVLRFGTLGDQSFWYDESLTVGLTRAPFGTYALGVEDQAEPPLYFLLAWGWTRVFGWGEDGLRSLSAVFGVLTVPVAYAIGRTLLSRRVGLIAAALVAVSPVLIHYSQEARAYALYVLLSALATLFFLRSLDRPDGRGPAAWAAASALAVAAHYFALFLAVAQAAWLLVRARDSRPVRLALVGAGVAVAALAPLALHQRAHGVEWIANTPLAERLKEAGRILLVDNAPGTAAVRLAEVAWLAAVAVALVRVRGRGRRATTVALLLAGAVVALPIAGAAVGSDYVLGRNLLPAFVPLAVVAAVALALPRRAWVSAAAALPLLAVSVWIDRQAATDASVHRDDWRAVARALGPPASARAVVVLPGWQSRPLRLYAPRLRVMEGSTAVKEVDLVTYRGPRPRPGPAVQAPPPQPFRRVASATVQRMTITRFRAPRPTAFRPPTSPQRAEAETPLVLVGAP